MYFDNNATTALDPLVLDAMTEECLKGPSNPSSVHAFGQSARGRLATARHQVASFFGVLPQEVIFTSGGTEALNQALSALAPGRTVLSSVLEHSAVLEPLKKGCQLRLIEGAVTLDKVDLEDVGLIALMAANNETGVKNPIKEIAALAASRGIPLVVDGVSVVGKEKIILHPGITAFAFSAHKFHGPKGIGVLIARNRMAPLLQGGPQENGRRAGTENLPAIIGLAKALSLLGDYSYVTALRDDFESRLLGADILLNGNGERIGNTSNLAFEGVDGESLLFHLDQAGVFCSHGSACSAGALEVSRVLLGLGLGMKRAKSSLRFSFSRFNTPDEIARGAEIIKETVKKLRK